MVPQCMKNHSGDSEAAKKRTMKCQPLKAKPKALDLGWLRSAVGPDLLSVELGRREDEFMLI